MNNKNAKTIHDINNLLASIMLSAELLALRAPGAKKESKKIIADAKKVARLVKKITA